jgi:hypothetical protein
MAPSPIMPVRFTVASAMSHLEQSKIVMRGLDPRIHHLREKDGLPGQARQ